MDLYKSVLKGKNNKSCDQQNVYSKIYLWLKKT